MAKTKTPGAAFGGSLKPKLIREVGDKKSKVYSFVIPKFGRFAYTRDPGEAKMFMTNMLSTRLGAILRAPDYSVRGQMRLGSVIDEYDLGSGYVTNVGVTALANDSNWQTEAAEPINTFNVCKYMDWGKGGTGMAATDWKLQEKVENESGKKEAVAASSSVLKFAATGNAKIIITGTLEALGTAEIKEWGLFSAKKTEGEAKKESTSNTTTTLTDTAKLVAPGSTASAAKVRGAQQYVLETTEPEVAYGLILKNTTEVATVPGFVKSASAEAAAEPKAKTKYTIIPVMWDHRTFSVINVEKGNKIEFPYELEIKSGT